MLFSRINKLKHTDPLAYKVLRRITRNGTDKNGNLTEEARAAAKKAARKLGYAR